MKTTSVSTTKKAIATITVVLVAAIFVPELTRNRDLGRSAGAPQPSEVAAKTADLYNGAGFDMIYLDALDGGDTVAGRPNVRVEEIDGLLVDYLRSKKSRVVIRGLRAMQDFEYEFEMALMNSHMFPEMETVFLMTSERWFYVSSSRLRELVRFGMDVSEFVPPGVNKKLRERLGPKS